MSERLNHLATTIQNVLGARVQSVEVALNEVTLVVAAQDYFTAALMLRDEPALAFEQLIDL